MSLNSVKFLQMNETLKEYILLFLACIIRITHATFLYAETVAEINFFIHAKSNLIMGGHMFIYETSGIFYT